MGLKRFFENVRHLGNTRLDQIESRSSQVFDLLNGDLGHYLNNIATASYYGVGGNSAMRVATVFTCVMVRGESLSTCPASVKQFTPEGSINATTQPAHRLVHDRPNPFQTAAQFWKSVSIVIDLNGEAFCPITYSGRMQPIQIDMIPECEAVNVYEVAGRPWYEYKGRKYQDWEMLHFMDMSLDGKRGISKIRYNAETIGYAKKLKSYGSNAIGIKPPGFFSTEANYDLVKKQEDSISKTWRDKIASGDAPVLPFGLKYNNLQITPDDAQYLDSIGATKEDIYGIFRVPPTLAQNYERATFANAEQQDLVFIKYTMLPIITNIEQECNAKLFPEANITSAEPFYVKFNVNAFMRGDFRTRTEGYRSLMQSGLISINQVAELEDLPSVPNGDDRYIPMNLIALSKYDEFISQVTKPTNTTAGNEGGAENSERSEILKGIYNNGKKNGHAVN